MTGRSLDCVHRLRYFRFCSVLHINNVWTIHMDDTLQGVCSTWLSGSVCKYNATKVELTQILASEYIHVVYIYTCHVSY